MLYDLKNNIFKPEKDYYKPIRSSIVFSSNYIEYKSNGDKVKSLSIKEYLNIIKPYLSYIINDYKTQGEWKIHLTMAIKFFLQKIVKKLVLCMEVMMGNETDENIEELFDSFSQIYQKNVEESMKRSEFVFDSINSLYYKLHKISLNRGGSYIDFPKRLRNKKATINLKNNDDKCFQYSLTVALNYQNIKNNPKRLPKIKLFIDQYNWKEINFPSHKKDWKKFKSNNKPIVLNILYVPYNTERIRHAYKSRYNLERENQVILLIITDDKNGITQL